MEIREIKSRSVMFTYHEDEWDLNLHLIKGKYNNYLIDTGLGSGSVEPVMDYIDNRIPTVVINTHYHWDHIWGNSVFKDCTILSHRLCRQIIESEWDRMLSQNTRYVTGRVEKCLPNLVFETELYFPQDGIRAIYTPGHSIDSVSVIDEQDKVINLGDNVGDTVDELVPSLDCTKEQYIDTLKKIKAYDFDTCISGHNVLLDSAVIDKILSLV